MSDIQSQNQKPNSKTNIQQEIYEYIPEDALPSKKSHYEIFDDTKNIKFKDINTVDSSLKPSLAYESFKHKNWENKQRLKDKSNIFRSNKNDEFNSFPTNRILNSKSIADQTKQESTSQGLFLRDTTTALFETPIERLNRLENELKELQDYLNDIISNSEDDMNEKKPTLLFSDSSELKVLLGEDPLLLLEEVKVLEAQVSGLNRDPRIQSLFEKSDPITFKADGFSAINKHLDSIYPSHQKASKDDEPTETDSHNFTTYELYSDTMIKPAFENSRIISLENRITTLENKIGISKMEFLPFGNISSALTHFSKRLDSMDHRRIDIINKKIQNLLVDLQVIQSRRNELIGSTLDDQKLNFLYDLCYRWKLLANSTPTIVKRLQTLKSLHQEANSLNTRMKLMETQQEEMKNLLTSTRNSFNELQQAMTQSNEWAKRTTDALQRRMEEIKSSK